MFISGCPERPVPGEPLDTATVGGSEGPDATSSLTGGGPPGTTGSTDPGPEPTTTGPGTEGSGGSGGGDVSTTVEPPADCGPPCAEEWVHEGPLVLNGDGDAVDYTCMRAIVKGDLYITGGADPAEIASLANLERVEGKFTIAGHHDLTDLSAFGCLREVESLTLSEMPQLVDLGALAGLRAAPRIVLDDLGIAALPAFDPEFAGITALTLRSNAALVELDAASSWGRAAGPLELTIRDHVALPGLTGLAGLLAGGGVDPVHIELADLPALTSLAGLEPVVFADLHFEHLPQVPDLAPLANLEIGGQITFNDLPAVTDLAGLAALVSVGSFTIGDCTHGGAGGMDGLTSLAGLAGLKSVGHLALADNDQLASLAGAPALTQLAGFAGIGNPLLTQDAYDEFLEQIEGDPWHCVGDWDRCQCFIVQPGWL